MARRQFDLPGLQKDAKTFGTTSLPKQRNHPPVTKEKLFLFGVLIVMGAGWGATQPLSKVGSAKGIVISV